MDLLKKRKYNIYDILNVLIRNNKQFDKDLHHTFFSCEVIESAKVRLLRLFYSFYFIPKHTGLLFVYK